MNPIDPDSIVLETSGGVNPGIDIDSITLSDEVPKSKATFMDSVKSAFTPDNIRKTMFDPMQMVGVLGKEMGEEEYKNIEWKPLKSPQFKSRDVKILSNLTGIQEKDLSDNYEAIKFAFDLATAGPAIAGAEVGKRVEPETAEGVMNALMTPTLLASAVTNPIGTASGLAVFTALDYLIPTDIFIPKDEKGNVKDQSQAASIRMVGMLVKGAITGGILKKGETVLKQAEVTTDFAKFLSQYSKEKLASKQMPTEVEISPKQMIELNAVKKPESYAVSAAERKRLEKRGRTARREVDDIKRKLYENEVVDTNLHDSELIRQAKNEVVAEIDALEAKNGKVRNRHQQVRYKLKSELVHENSVASDLGVPVEKVQNALANETNIKVPIEKLVEIGLKDEKALDQVVAILAPEKKAEGAASAVEVAKVTPVEGTGATKTRGLAKGVETKAIENKLTETFGELPQYKMVNMKDQAAKAAEILSKDPELARKVAMGEAPAPEGIIPEALFVALEESALRTGDVALLRDLATKSSLSAEATTMGQRIRTLAERNPESPTNLIQEVQKAREEASVKRFGNKEKVKAVKEKQVREMKAEMKKATPKLSEWESFLNELMC